MKRDSLSLGSLQKSLEVMALFSAPPHEVSLTSASEATGLDRSAVQRILHTLHEEGWLLKHPETKKYSPSLHFLEGAFAFLSSDPLMKNASPHVMALSKEIKENINVARADGTDIVYVTRMPVRRAPYISTLIGRRVPALNTTSGRAILSTRPEDEIRHACKEWPLINYLPTTTTDRADILELIMECRRTGFSVSEGQILPNELDIASPIRAADGQAIGALHVSVSNLRWNRESLRQDIAPALVETAKAITPPADERA